MVDQRATTTLLCARCSQQAAPASNLCDQCGNHTLRNLRHIEFCALALSAIPIRSGDDSRGAPGFASSSPARDAVIVETDPRSKADDHGHVGALAALSSWTRLVSYERDTPQPERCSITGECDYLRRHHPWILAQGWADEYAAELEEIRRRLVALLGLAPDPPAGDCLCVGCDGQVYPLTDMSGVRCRACLAEYTGPALLRFRYMQETTA